MRGCVLGCSVGFQLFPAVCEMQERGTAEKCERSLHAAGTCSESRISSVTDTPSPFSDHLSSSHVPSIRFPFSFCFLPPPLSFLASIHPQEGQPEEAQGSTNAQALEAAAAATVSAPQTRLMHCRWELALCLGLIKGAWNVSEFHKGMASAPLG